MYDSQYEDDTGERNQEVLNPQLQRHCAIGTDHIITIMIANATTKDMP